MMSWFGVLKDFKTNMRDPDTGELSPNVLGRFDPDTEEVFINLSAQGLEGKSEEEMIDMITETLAHEYTHMAFNKIEGAVDKYYKELFLLLAKFHSDVLDKKAALPLPEDEMIAIVKKIVGHKITDELTATRSNLKDGPSRILIEGYHKDASKKFGRMTIAYLDALKEKSDKLLGGLREEMAGNQHIHRYINLLHGLSMQTIEFLKEKMRTDLTSLYELLYKNIITKLTRKELTQNPDLNNQYVRILIQIVKSERWDLLEDFWEREVGQ